MRLFILISLLSACLSGCANVHYRTLKVDVRDAETQSPISPALVRSQSVAAYLPTSREKNPPVNEVTTGKDGACELQVPKDCSSYMTIKADGYASVAQSLSGDALRRGKIVVLMRRADERTAAVER